MRNPKLTQAFTLIELLTVMAIIMIIAGMVVGVSSTARESARRRKAEVMIAALEIGISMYHADTGEYPNDTSNAMLVTDLTEDPGDEDGQRGPYMEFKDKDLDGGEVVDPWKNAYCYDEDPAKGNTESFNLWSYGPDGENDSTDPDADCDDDIINW